MPRLLLVPGNLALTCGRDLSGDGGNTEVTEASQPRTALDSPAVRAVLRRRRYWALGLVCAGLMALSLAFTVAALAERRANQLQSRGVETTGIVTEFHPRGRVGPNAVTVSYRVGDQEFSARVNLSDSSRAYQLGDPVVILVDPENLGHATIFGETNETAVEYTTFSIGFVVGVMSIIPGTGMLVSARRLRRILGSGPWRTAIGIERGYRLGWLQLGLSVESEPERVKELVSAVRQRHQSTGDLLLEPTVLEVVGRLDDRMVARIAGQASLLVLREPFGKRLSQKRHR
jgi:hypothetical protein